jgi:hypothetical protein
LAPVDVNETFLLDELVADAVIRIKIDVEATELPDRISVTELPNPVVEFVEISNPDGAEILMFSVRLLPETVKV